MPKIGKNGRGCVIFTDMAQIDRDNFFRYLITVAIVACFCGFLIGRLLTPDVINSTKSLRENNKKYTFIHPLLVVGRQDASVPSPQYAKLANSIEEYIGVEKVSSGLLDASVYFINYKNNGGSCAVNENVAYAPASLLKVVVMIGYLKESDTDEKLLSRSFVYNSSIARSIEGIPFEAPSTLKIGQYYTVEELMYKMIVNSDNGAMYLLLDNMSDSYLAGVYKDLGLNVPTSDNTNYTISAKDYSLFFRILYNATYLSRESSEKAFSLLSQAQFKDGLVAGLPNGIVVAHKYGEHINGKLGSVDSVELHDCGYIYPDEDPYLLCVMTKSKNLDESKRVISNISKIIYNNR